MRSHCLKHGCTEEIPAGETLCPRHRPARRQPDPIPNAGPGCWELVLVDMYRRDQTGRARYGVKLQPHNGRDALKDAYEEALDLAVYLRQVIYERDGR